MSIRNQILCLSGGGYRGLYTSSVLEDLEEKLTPDLIGNKFDVIAGTSVGAILAAGIAFGIPAKDISKAFRENGPKIFTPKFGRNPLNNMFPGVFSSRYSNDGLRDTILAILGPHAKTPIGKIKKNLMIVATNRQDGEVAIMKSWDKRGAYADVPIIEGLIASAAAPTYFPERVIKSRALIDGGIVANAPDLLAVTHWMAYSGLSHLDIDVLSIGTAGEIQRALPDDKTDKGLIRLFKPKTKGEQNLFSITLACQQSASLDACHNLLQDNHLRLDIQPVLGETESLGLDKVSEKVNETLIGLAKRTISNIRSTPSQYRRLEAMLRHKPI